MHSKRGLRFATLLIPVLALLIGTSVVVLARANQPPPDAAPGAVGFQGALLAAIDTSAAPGYELQLAQSVFEPGAYVTSHIHPTAIVVCVQSGALGFALQHGSGMVTRGAGPGTPTTQEPLMPGTEITLEPQDCVAFDHFAVHTSHTGWNASDGETVLIEARLVKKGEPFTVFINAEGTPVTP
jgi:hypothetical protein